MGSQSPHLRTHSTPPVAASGVKWEVPVGLVGQVGQVGGVRADLTSGSACASGAGGSGTGVECVRKWASGRRTNSPTWSACDAEWGRWEQVGAGGESTARLSTVPYCTVVRPCARADTCDLPTPRPSCRHLVGLRGPRTSGRTAHDHCSPSTVLSPQNTAETPFVMGRRVVESSKPRRVRCRRRPAVYPLSIEQSSTYRN